MPFQFAGGAAAGPLPQDQVAGQKGVGVTKRPHRDVLRGPGPDPAQDLERARHLRSRRVAERHLTRQDRAGQGANAPGTGGDHAHLLDRRLGQLLGGREKAIEAVGSLDHAAKAPGQSAGNGRGRRHRHLLSQDGAHRQLEPVPGAWCPQSWMPREDGPKPGIATEVLGDHCGIRVQIEHAPDTVNDQWVRPRVGEPDVQIDRRRGRRQAHGEGPDPAVDRDGPPVTICSDHLHPRRGARGQEAHQRIPVERGLIGQAHADRFRHDLELSADIQGVVLAS